MRSVSAALNRVFLAFFGLIIVCAAAWFLASGLDAGHWVRTVDLPNARLIATSVHRCDEVWREPEDEPDSDDGADDELE